MKATAQWLMYCMVHNIEKLWQNSEVNDVANNGLSGALSDVFRAV